MAATLRIIDGPQSGATCELRLGQRAVLGRGEQTDLTILDTWASRAHCAVTVQPDGIVLEDLDSKNGTYVSGQRVERTRLPDGSLIQVGTTTVQVLTQASTAAAPAAAPPAAARPPLRKALYAVGAVVLAVGLGYGGFHAFWGTGVPRGKVDIVSEPSQADVFLDEDEEYAGATPLRDLELPVGQHTLRVVRKGYQAYSGTFTVREGGASPVRVVLEPVRRGWFQVRSKPDGAAVYLEGVYRGRTPCRIADLEPRPYSLRLVYPNHADWHRKVEVSAGENPPVEAVLGSREIAYYLKALKKDPNNVSYHSEVAHLFLLEQNVEACIQHLTQALEIELAGKDTTRQDERRNRLAQLIQKIYNNDHFTYGDERFVDGVRRRIDAMFADLLLRHPRSDGLRKEVVRLYKRASTSLSAKLAALRQRIRASPKEFDLYRTAAGLLALGRDYSDAVDVAQRAQKALPGDYRPSMLEGQVYLHAMHHGVGEARRKAIEALNKALKQCQSEAAREEIRTLLGEATR
ncbi:MAG: PEGA domain-containing protein [Candidatus Brocadiia bacterium]